MSKPVVALQLYTVRDFAEKDLKATLQKVKDMGYEYVELAGTYGLSATDFRAVLDDAGLNAISAHVGFGAFENSVENTVADYNILGCKYIGIPHLDASLLPGGERWEYSKEILQKAAAACKAVGIVPMYHNHAHEFEKLPCGTYILDEFFNQLPEFEAQIDSGWVDAVDLCPAEYIKQYAGRCPSVHLKDTDKNQKIDKPTGQGTQDIPATTSAAAASGTKVFVAELDEAVGLSSLDAAAQSLEYLKSIGY